VAKKEKKSDALNFQENQCVVELKDIDRSIKDLFAQIVNVSRSKAMVERFRRRAWDWHWRFRRIIKIIYHFKS